MGLKGMSVGVRLDGTIDLEIARGDDEDEEEGWNFSNVDLEEAEFLHGELGRAIARQKERGFPKPEPPKQLTPPSEDPSSGGTSEPG